MKLIAILSLLFVLPAADSQARRLDHIDISPAAMMNVGNGHGGRFMGGALTADLYFNKVFALRSTLGFTKHRYYPSDLNYDNADYGFWLSLAPYAEVTRLGAVRPYLAVVGTFSGGQTTAPINTRDTRQLEPTPVNGIAAEPVGGSAFSLGGTLGTKFSVAGPVAVFAEITHFFVTSVTRDGLSFNSGVLYVNPNYDWDRTPTYLAVGLSYSIPLNHPTEKR